MLKCEIGMVVDWSTVDKEVKDVEIKHLLRNALTDRVNDCQVFMKGIDTSYHYEGYATFKKEDMK